jgi:hypothetical protein
MTPAKARQRLPLSNTPASGGADSRQFRALDPRSDQRRRRSAPTEDLREASGSSCCPARASPCDAASSLLWVGRFACCAAGAPVPLNVRTAQRGAGEKFRREPPLATSQGPRRSLGQWHRQPKALAIFECVHRTTEPDYGPFHSPCLSPSRRLLYFFTRRAQGKFYRGVNAAVGLPIGDAGFGTQNQ